MNLGKNLFLDISSTTLILIPSLYQCIGKRSIEVVFFLFLLLPRPLSYLHFNLFGHERISRPSCEPLYATNTSHRKQETFLYEYPLH
jgi:hypothetical protein